MAGREKHSKAPRDKPHHQRQGESPRPQKMGGGFPRRHLLGPGGLPLRYVQEDLTNERR